MIKFAMLIFLGAMATFVVISAGGMIGIVMNFTNIESVLR